MVNEINDIEMSLMSTLTLAIFHINSLYLFFIRLLKDGYDAKGLFN